MDNEDRVSPVSFVLERLKAVRYAVQGMRNFMISEANARLHVIATVLVIAAGFFFGISAEDWRWLIFAIGWVWCTEVVNTAIERLCDVVTREHHPGIGAAKDLASAAVLISAIAATGVGLLTFWPYLW